MKKIKNPRKKKTSIITRVLLMVVLVLMGLYLVRAFSEKQLDDVNPLIACDEDLIQKADILYVVPKFKGENISESKEWCSKILSYNKTLGLHGVYHTYQEFAVDRDESYLQEGEEEFKECFGYYPERFKAPQVRLSSGNKELLLQNGYSVDNLVTDIIHKIYHCDNVGYYPNWVSDLI